MDFTLYFITVNKYRFCISVIGYINVQIIGIRIGRSLVQTVDKNITIIHTTPVHQLMSCKMLAQHRDVCGIVYRPNPSLHPKNNIRTYSVVFHYFVFIWYEQCFKKTYILPFIQHNLTDSGRCRVYMFIYKKQFNINHLYLSIQFNDTNVYQNSAIFHNVYSKIVKY